MDPGEALDEVRALAAEVEDKGRQLRGQQQITDELRRTKQNSRLRTELDIAQTELQSLRALLRCGRGFRRENDDLRAELRHVRDVGIGEIEREIHKRVAGQTQIAIAELKDVVDDVFDQCSNEVIKQIDQRSLS
jgi:hypothetical protein